MSRRPLARIAPLIIFVALAALALADAAPAQGASFTVDATHDAVDASPGDGACADAGGACTLRAAVMETNALPGADEISLPPGTYALSIPGAGEDASATGDLDVTDDLTIAGAERDATVIDGGQVDRVIHAAGEFVLTLADLSIQNGKAAGGQSSPTECNTGPDPAVPAFARGGGVCSESAVLEITRVNLRSNTAGVGGSALHSTGTLRLLDSAVASNSGIGAAIWNSGTAAIENSTIEDNSGAVLGGGVYNESGSNSELAITNSTVRGNSALDAGGGFFNGGTATIRSSTVVGNTAGQSGGGGHNSSVLEVTNSTISGNTARFGGGIYNNPAPLPPGLIGQSGVGMASQSLGGLVTATNVTITANTAAEGGGILESRCIRRTRPRESP